MCARSLVGFSLLFVVFSLYFISTEGTYCGVACIRRADCNSGPISKFPDCGSCVCSDRKIISCPKRFKCPRGCQMVTRNGCHTCSCFMNDDWF